MGEHYAIQGPTELYRFKRGVEFSKFADDETNTRMLKLNRDETDWLLKHFESKDDVFEECLAEVNRLKNWVGLKPFLHPSGTSGPSSRLSQLDISSLFVALITVLRMQIRTLNHQQLKSVYEVLNRDEAIQFKAFGI